MKTYKQGEKINDINELFEQDLVWWQGKAHNIEVIKSWQYRFIEQQMSNFYKAEKITAQSNDEMKDHIDFKLDEQSMILYYAIISAMGAMLKDMYRKPHSTDPRPDYLKIYWETVETIRAKKEIDNG